MGSNSRDSRDGDGTDFVKKLTETEARNIYFIDGIRRIDYILVWSKSEDSGKYEEHNKIRECFQQNLIDEGLELEYDDRGDCQYVKIHAQWETLSRYAEIMKMRLPMKETCVSLQSKNNFANDILKFLYKPFKLDENVLPTACKTFTCVFQRDKEYLFDIPADKKELVFSHSQRSQIVNYILRRKRYLNRSEESEEEIIANATTTTTSPPPSTTTASAAAAAAELEDYEFGIVRLLTKNIYIAAYPLHGGSWKPWTKASMRQLLYKHWAHWKNFYKEQPLDYIRIYFGDKIALYFTWLGYYTYMLIPASIIGILVSLYGLITLQNDAISSEGCDENNRFYMCPSCSGGSCGFTDLADSCTQLKAAHVFDNAVTVFFSIFMALWGTIYLEFWKRRQSEIQNNCISNSDNSGGDGGGFVRGGGGGGTVEPPRPEYIERLQKSKSRKFNDFTKTYDPYLPFSKRLPIYCFSVSIMLFMILIAVCLIGSLLIYRSTLQTKLFFKFGFSLQLSKITSSLASSILNLIVIFILKYVYEWAAMQLTEMECLRTQSEFESSLIFKLYVLQFVNYYSSLFYIAFFKGSRFSKTPVSHNDLYDYFQIESEECDSSGDCLIELCIQLAVIFVGKQILNNIIEVISPRIGKIYRSCILKRRHDAPQLPLAQVLNDLERRNRKPWEKDFVLNSLGTYGLFDEYMEILIQFGFVTLFVAAFPLAPLFAMLNNIIEIRSDASKFVTALRRPNAEQSTNIGIWYNVLYVISRLSILTNGLIIAFTSGFIDRLVYQFSVSETNSFDGFTNYSLSYFNVSHFKYKHTAIGKFENITFCRFKGYLKPPWDENPYDYSLSFWHVLAAKLAFLVIFENMAVLIVSLVAYCIPDVPSIVREMARRQTFLYNEIVMKTELQKARDMTYCNNSKFNILRRQTFR